MSDIVDRLKERADPLRYRVSGQDTWLLMDAIAEIERLRAELATETAWKDQWRGTAEKLGETIETLCADLAEARAELAKIHRSWGLIQESKGP